MCYLCEEDLIKCVCFCFIQAWLLLLWAYVLNNQEIQKLGKYLNSVLFRYTLIAFNNWFCLRPLYREILQIDVRKLTVIVSKFLIYWGNWNPTSNTVHKIFRNAYWFCHLVLTNINKWFAMTILAYLGR